MDTIELPTKSQINYIITTETSLYAWCADNSVWSVDLNGDVQALFYVEDSQYIH